MPEPRPLDACLENADSLSQILMHARLLSRIQRIISAELAPPLGTACRVANLRQSVLIIHADSGAVAAKLRQLGARLCRKLMSQGIDCTEITVRVQAAVVSDLPAIPSPRTLSTAAQSHLGDLVSRLPPDDPLAQRVRELVAKSFKSARE